MATRISELPCTQADSGRVNIVVDTPKGSRNKYKFDDQHDQWRLSKVLPQGSTFPFDFGFVPSTEADDGDPLDVLLLGDEPTFAGCIVPGRLIGALEAEQTEKGETIRNDRLVAVIETPYNPAPYASVDELNKQLLDELEHFFVTYNQAEGREFKPLGRSGPERARELLQQAAARRRGK